MGRNVRMKYAGMLPAKLYILLMYHQMTFPIRFMWMSLISPQKYLIKLRKTKIRAYSEYVRKNDYLSGISTETLLWGG